MSSQPTALSALCLAATILDLETGVVYKYPDIKLMPAPKPPPYTLGIEDLPEHLYLIYWPLGVFAYLATHLKPDQLQPSAIDAAHKRAKLLKPVVLSRMRWWI
jgi:hypothetical protein